MSTDRLDATGLERYDSLFITPHGDDVALGCPARVRGEAERGRRVLVLALFEPVGGDTAAARAMRELGADYAAAGLPAARERRAHRATSPPSQERGPEDEDVALEAARLLTETGPRTQAVHVYAPLGLGAFRRPPPRRTRRPCARSPPRPGRNLFLYEERPEAFVPGAVRTRLALLGARLPPGAVKSPARVRACCVTCGASTSRPGCGATRRGSGRGSGSSRGAPALSARRGPGTRCAPSAPGSSRSCTSADEDARDRAQAIAEALLPKDDKGRPAAGAALQRARGRRGEDAGRRLPRRAALALPSLGRRPPRGPAPPGDGRGLSGAQILTRGASSTAASSAAQRSGSCSHSVLR